MVSDEEKRDEEEERRAVADTKGDCSQGEAKGDGQDIREWDI
jgi:hypothetical protein